jgi:hypothetical protein
MKGLGERISSSSLMEKLPARIQMTFVMSSNHRPFNCAVAAFSLVLAIVVIITPRFIGNHEAIARLVLLIGIW